MRASVRPARDSDSAHSHTRSTVQPAARSPRDTRRSRARFVSTLFRQNARALPGAR